MLFDNCTSRVLQVMKRESHALRKICFAMTLACFFGRAAISAERVTFRSGEDGYSGTSDAEIWALAPATILNSNPQVTVDQSNGGDESQVLMRFDGIIGKQAGQIPPNARVVSARLEVGAFDQGDSVHLHRMLVPFGRAPTWNRLIDGVSADDLEALRVTETFTFGRISASASYVAFEVTDTVQAWVNGAKNHGWVFINTGGNGWDFYSSDFDKVTQRPRLIVEFETKDRKSKLVADKNKQLAK